MQKMLIKKKNSFHVKKSRNKSNKIRKKMVKNAKNKNKNPFHVKKYRNK